MVKTRMSVIDIRAVVSEMKKQLEGLRLANIYDLAQAKTYLLKFALPDKKAYVVIESGARIHTTEFEREKQGTPSHFVMKLRKTLRTRRLESIEQMGVDRIVNFRFSSKDGDYHLIVEFFAKGNVILTDKDFRIIGLLRTHSLEEDVRFAVGETYPVTKRLQFTRVTRESLAQAVQQTSDENALLRQVLGGSYDYGTGFVDHCLQTAGVPLNTRAIDLKVQQQQQQGEMDDVAKLVDAFREADDFIDKCATEPQPGFIVLVDEDGKKKKKKKSEQLNSLQEQQTQTNGQAVDLPVSEEERNNFRRQYDDFTPFLFNQMKGNNYVTFTSFNACVDEFYTAVETSRIEQQKSSVEKTVNKKLEKVKMEYQQKLDSYVREQRNYELYATLIEQNHELVDKAIKVVCSAVAQAINWEDIKQVLKEQRKQGDPLAKAITHLKLESNQITMTLTPREHLEEEDDEEEDEEEDNENNDKEQVDQIKSVNVDLDITTNAFNNAEYFYDLKKRSMEKMQKTLQMGEKTFKAAEKKTERSMQKKQSAIKADIFQMRKKFWFEKFNWFITSENYLVISGRDAQQNDQIVKRYMKKGDIYVHADIHGASSCVIKNPSGNPIPHLSLTEAGIHTVCRSAAWDAKVLTSAWWVYPEQVSKSAPTGEYLSTGSFMIRGKKNFLTPSALIMGLAILFRVDDSCIANHLGERKIRTNIGDEPPLEEQTAVNDAVAVQIEEQQEAQVENINTPSAVTLPLDDNAANSNDDVVQRMAERYQATLEHDPNVGSQIMEELKREEQIIKMQLEEKRENQKKGLSLSDKKKLKKLKSQGLDEQTAKQLLLNEKSQQKQVAPEQSKEGEAKAASATEIPTAQAKKEQQLQQQQKKKKKKKNRRDESSDEEDKLLRMRLMGQVPVGNRKQGDKKVAADQQQEQQQLASKLVNKKPSMKRRDVGTEQEVLQTNGTQRDEEEIKQIMADENITLLDEEDKMKLSELDCLTGMPRDEDVILYAIPVCAPYVALKNYKYKVKLIPGNTKRGKASKNVMELLSKEAKNNEKEQNAIKGITDVDVTAAMVGNVKVSSSVVAPSLPTSAASGNASKKKVIV